MATVDVDGARIEYTDERTGPAAVFVHGAYVTGALWQDLAGRLSDSNRCIAPTYPFGAQAEPVGADVDLGVAASGRRIVGFLDALNLSNRPSGRNRAGHRRFPEHEGG